MRGGTGAAGTMGALPEVARRPARHLCIITPRYDPAPCGIAHYAAQLAAEFAASDRISILTSAQAEYSSSPGVTVEPAFDLKDPGTFRGLAERVGLGGADWAWLQYEAFLFTRPPQTLLAAELARLRRGWPSVRLVVTLHEIGSAPLRGWRSWARALLRRKRGARERHACLREIATSADLILTPVAAWGHRIRRWIPTAAVHYLPMSSSIARVLIGRAEARARLGIGEGTIVLGVFGRGSPDFEHERSAMAAMDRAGIPAIFLHLGDGAERARRSLGERRVIAGGVLPSDEISRRLAAVDIYLAGFHDGVSTRRTSFLAALQHGLAVIGTLGDDTDDELTRHAGGAFVLVGRRPDLRFIQSVERLASRQEVRTDLGRNAEELFRSEFTWDTISTRVKRILAGNS